jgi:hypothetical protein
VTAQPSQGLLLLGLAVGLGACGGAAKYSNAPGPAAPIVVAAAITRSGVNLSPDHFGAGVVELIVTNQTGSSQQLIVQGGHAFQQQTAPINPNDTARLKAPLDAGRYTVSVRDAGVKAAMLAVGSPRPSAPGQIPGR